MTLLRPSHSGAASAKLKDVYELVSIDFVELIGHIIKVF